MSRPHGWPRAARNLRDGPGLDERLRELAPNEADAVIDTAWSGFAPTPVSKSDTLSDNFNGRRLGYAAPAQIGDCTGAGDQRPRCQKATSCNGETAPSVKTRWM
jgi:hypothetical protein